MKRGGAEPSVAKLNDDVIELTTYLHNQLRGKSELPLTEKDRIRTEVVRKLDPIEDTYIRLKSQGADVHTVDENLNHFYDKAEELTEFPSKHNVPADSEYLIDPPRDTFEIKDGDQLVDFDGEYKYGRYYSHSEVTKLNGKNPFTNRTMSPLLYFTAVVTAGSSRRTKKTRK